MSSPAKLMSLISASFSGNHRVYTYEVKAYDTLGNKIGETAKAGAVRGDAGVVLRCVGLAEIADKAVRAFLQGSGEDIFVALFPNLNRTKLEKPSRPGRSEWPTTCWWTKKTTR